MELPQKALALRLDHGQEPERCADQERRRRVEEGGGCLLWLPTEDGGGHAEGDGVMAGGASGIHLGAVAAEGGIGSERGGHPQRLAAHLAASLAELTDALHRLEGVVESPASGEVAPGQGTQGGRRCRRIAWTGRSFELAREEPLHPGRIRHASRLTD